MEEVPVYVVLAKLWKNAIINYQLAQNIPHASINPYNDVEMSVRYARLLFYPTCLSNQYDLALNTFVGALFQALANIEERIRQQNFRTSYGKAEMRAKDILLALQML